MAECHRLIFTQSLSACPSSPPFNENDYVSDSSKGPFSKAYERKSDQKGSAVKNRIQRLFSTVNIGKVPSRSIDKVNQTEPSFYSEVF